MPENEPFPGKSDDGNSPDASNGDESMAAAEQAIDDIAAEFETQHPSGPEAELAEAQGRALRAQAELENFRKRSRREIEDSKRYATIPLIRDLLPAIDNLNRAVDAADADVAASGLLEGVKMVATQLQSVLGQHHCQAIEGEGHPFDPNFHEAIQQMPHPQIPKGHVGMVHQVGYRLHDRVIRPSQVIVSTGPAE